MFEDNLSKINNFLFHALASTTFNVITSFHNKNFMLFQTNNLISCITNIFIFSFTVCTPFGFVRLFGVVGQVLVKPHLLRDVNEEYIAFHMEEASVKRKLANLELQNVSINESLNGTYTSNNTTTTYDTPSGSYILHNMLNGHQQQQHSPNHHHHIRNNFSYYYNNLSSRTSSLTHLIQRKPMNGELSEHQAKLNERLRELETERKELEKLKKSSAFQRNFVYPLAMLLLLFFTGITILLVVQNTLELLIGIKALPLSTRVS